MLKVLKIEIISLIIILVAPVASAQVLYRISSNSTAAPSYILATNKLMDMTFIDTIPNVFKCFSNCNKVITEFAMQDYEARYGLGAVRTNETSISN